MIKIVAGVLVGALLFGVGFLTGARYEHQHMQDMAERNAEAEAITRMAQ